MAFNIRDPETERKVRELAQMLGVSLTEAITIAVRERLEYLQKLRAHHERLALEMGWDYAKVSGKRGKR